MFTSSYCRVSPFKSNSIFRFCSRTRLIGSSFDRVYL
nr:MAG TPA: hypothetical protein [Bacteriophage sp.]